MNLDLTLADVIKLAMSAGAVGILIAQLRGVREDTKEIKQKQDAHAERVSGHDTRLAVLEAKEDVADRIVGGLERLSRDTSRGGE